MGCFNFPKIFKGNSVDIITGKEAAVVQLGLLINSELFEFRYDPVYGSNLPLLRFKPDNQLTRDLIVDAIYDAQMFCPNIRFNRNQVKIEKIKPGQLLINVDATLDNNEFTTELQLLMEVES